MNLVGTLFVSTLHPCLRIHTGDTGEQVGEGKLKGNGNQVCQVQTIALGLFPDLFLPYLLSPSQPQQIPLFDDKGPSKLKGWERGRFEGHSVVTFCVPRSTGSARQGYRGCGRKKGLA